MSKLYSKVARLKYYFISGCKGSVEIRSRDFATVVKIDSKMIRGKQEIKNDYMIYAEVLGHCCWEVRSKHPNGGRRKELKTVERHSIPFNIKSIKKIKC